MLPICSFIIEIRDGPVPVVDYDGLMVDTERRAQTKSMKLIARIRMLLTMCSTILFYAALKKKKVSELTRRRSSSLQSGWSATGN